MILHSSHLENLVWFIESGHVRSRNNLNLLHPCRHARSSVSDEGTLILALSFVHGLSYHISAMKFYHVVYWLILM